MSTKILVVDDSATDRFIIQSMLNEYSILTACDGLAAMIQIDANPDIDLIILDLNMPNMNGFQLLEVLNSNDRYKHLRVIILTDYEELDNEIKGLKLGAVDYIRKPIQMETLKIRIDIHIELLKMQQLFKEKLIAKDLTFDTIFMQAPIGIAISHTSDPLYSDNKDFVSINPVFEQITGRTKEDLAKLGWANITHPDDVEEDIKNFKKLQSGEIKSYSMEKRFIKSDGSIVWVDMVVASLTLWNEHKFNHICLVQDISERKALEIELLESERSKSVLLSNIPGMAYRCNYDRNWTMQFVSDGCFDLTGYTPEHLLDNKKLSFNDMIMPEYREPLWNEWERILANRLPFKYEYEIITAKGEKKWILEMGQGIYNEQGQVEALEGIILDISDRKEIENSLRYNNEHDLWTGLLNRRYLENLLMHDAKNEPNRKRAIVSINLSSVNKLSFTYGFHYSQEVIKKAAKILSTLCTETRQLFNSYESRFVFYIKDYKEKNDLITFCETIVNTLDTIFSAERIGGGIGIVEIDNENGNDAELLLKNLLIASEKAPHVFEKHLGFCFFDKDMEEQIIREERVKLELELIELDEIKSGFYLQYQPILDLKTNQICGFEALARINSDKLGFISPLEFIPMAEKTKLIIPIGQRIIRRAFHFLNKLKDNGYHGISISINVSVIQLLEHDFNKKLFDLISEMEVNPENIELEITESVFADNHQEINRILEVLKNAGIHIAIDDFGTGYSTLARERELKVSCLKIDKYFIDKLVSLKEDEAITSDIISMAHKLGHYVVAEGVEYEAQRKYLEKYGCDKIQGYLISKPLDEEIAIKLLKNQMIINNEC